MVKNHIMFGNTSIMTMVGKVILLFIHVQQVIEGCYILGNHLLHLDMIVMDMLLDY